MRAVVGVITGIFVAGWLPAAWSDELSVPGSNPALNDRFFVHVGLFVPKSTTSAQLNSSTGVGTNVDFEQLLGIQTQKGVPDAAARWRISQRWRVELEYFELNRSGNRTVDRDIQWRDQLFPVNAQVASSFDVSDTRISMGYSFFKTPDKELGAGLGVHVLKYSASLGTASFGSQSGGATAPLPVASIYGQFALTDEWSVGSRVDWLSLSYSQYSGSITSVSADLMYQPFRHLGFGVAFRSLFVDFTSTNSGWNGKIKQSFQGPLFYANATF